MCLGGSWTAIEWVKIEMACWNGCENSICDILSGQRSDFLFQPN